MFLGILCFAFIILFIVLWIMISVKVAAMAKERGESYALYLLTGLCLSPATSALVLNLIAKKTERSMKEQIDVISQSMYAAAETLKRIEQRFSEDKADTAEDKD